MLPLKWEIVRKLYPNRYVKMQIVSSHMLGTDVKIVDEVEVLGLIEDPNETTQELLQAKHGVIVCHTSHEELKIKVRMR